MDSRSDEVVYKSHAEELMRFATGIVGPDDAADVVVDSFMRLTSSPVWNDARDRRALWYRAVIFESRSMRRSATRRRAREAQVVAANVAPTWSEPASDDERVRGALRALSAQQRAVVILTYWQDLRPGEVATLLGVSDGSVRKQLARARKKLRGALR